MFTLNSLNIIKMERAMKIKYKIWLMKATIAAATIIIDVRPSVATRLSELNTY